MRLSKQVLKNIPAQQNLSIPAAAIFELPEKVLQFGTGVLLRALPDYFIDKANKQGIFNGRIVVVKSTTGGDANVFNEQDNLYTVCVRGVEAGKTIDENIINASISRVIEATVNWQQVLDCAVIPSLEIIISNTTEVGIQLVEEKIDEGVPTSFPAKLLACLHARYQALGQANAPGMVILPTELITDNGNKLKSIVLQLCNYNNLPHEFISWINKANTFCNTLVDRIVPGKPAAAQLSELQQQLGYEDDLLTMTEVFRLWAIEGNDYVKQVLSFAAADEGIVITNNITIFKELKLRLLNGTHTFCSGTAFLAGIPLTRDAVQDAVFGPFMRSLMTEEIGPAIPCKIEETQRNTFAASTLDRFENGSIDHKWKSITVQYSSKMKLRNIPLLAEHYRKFGTVPKRMALCTAAHLLYMRAHEVNGKTYSAKLQDNTFTIEDDNAEFFYNKNKQTANTGEYCTKVLADVDFWQTDFKDMPGFTDAVKQYAGQIEEHGILNTIQQLN